MKRLRMLMIASLISVPAVGSVATPADACMGKVCDAVNRVCSKTITKGSRCLG